jgi:phenylpyruvate tautomerase PptA (4-oxalocrotonate tautomerase family)
MPVTQITLLEGYPAEVRERLVQRVSDAVRSVIAAPEAGTTTYIQHAATYRRDARAFASGAAAHPVASDVVRAFLEAMEARDLERAQSFLAPGFQMVFPGAARFTSLQDLVAWGRGRYQRVGKQIDGFDESWQGDRCVVYVRGTLHGVRPDGTPFEGVRFIDRFEVVQGQLTHQQVWNDLAQRAGFSG